MLKLKSLINVLLVLIISLCLNHINNSFAGNCDEKKTNAGVQTVLGNYNYAPGHECTKDPNMKYDTANSHETIARNGSANLIVTGNNGPFTWSVSGVGFTLEKENESTGPTNILYADGSACGAATITVTGCDGKEVKGFVRCISGSWVKISKCSNCDGTTATCRCDSYQGCGYQYCTLITGKYRYVDAYCQHGGIGCAAHCYSYNNNCPETVGYCGQYHECGYFAETVYEWQCH